MAIVEFCEVKKTYGRPGKTPAALDGIDLQIEEGSFCLLMGPSGAGKSTLLKLIMAMVRPDTGIIRVAGRDVHRLTKGSIPYLRRNIGVVFQDFKLLPEASPLENVRLALEVLGWAPKEVRRRARESLGAMGVDPDTRRAVRRMSGGEQQRVALARALAGSPALLLADEPTGNLDMALTVDVLARLEQVRAGGTTILLATHDPVVRDHSTADRRLDLEGGRLIDDQALSRSDAAAALAAMGANAHHRGNTGPELAAGEVLGSLA